MNTSVAWAIALILIMYQTRRHLESIHTYKQTNSINRSLILNSTYQPLFKSEN